jgi:hypothetical protein
MKLYVGEIGHELCKKNNYFCVVFYPFLFECKLGVFNGIKLKTIKIVLKLCQQQRSFLLKSKNQRG